MTWNLARRLTPVLTALALLAPRLANAQLMSTTGGTIPVSVATENPLYVTLSLYDCVHNGATQVAFDYVYAWDSSQTFEYDLAENSTCEPPTNSRLGGTVATDEVTSSELIEEGSRLDPSDSMTTQAGGADDTMTNLTFAGIWYYESQVTDLGTAQINYSAMPTAPPTLCPTNVSTVVYLCVNILDSGSTTTTTTTAGTPINGWISFVLQSAPPDAPGSPTVTPLDSGIKVSWDAVTTPEDAYGYIAYAQDPVSGDIVNSVNTSGGTEVTITRLRNGVTYNVYVVSLDNAGSNPPTTANQSLPSPVVQATPVASIPFFEQYKEDGGKENGCSNAGGASLLLLLPLAMLLRRRKRRSGFQLSAVRVPIRFAVLVFLLSLSAVARADDKDTEKDEQRPADAIVTHHYSPEWFRVDILTGLFTPNPDSEPGLTGAPYAQMFTQKNPLLTRVQLHVNFWNGLGHLSAGVSAGVWGISGHALLLDHVTASGDAEQLSVYPFSLLLGYRMDFIYTRYNVPVVPYVKVGYGLVYWLDTKNGLATTGVYNGQTWHSFGLAGGLEVAGGIEFPLDFLDPRRAANLDEDFGINSTGIFAEYSYNDWIGYNGGLRLNAASYSGGLYVAF